MRGVPIAAAVLLAYGSAAAQEGLPARQDLASAIILCDRALWDVRLAPSTASTIDAGRLPDCVDALDRWDLVYGRAEARETRAMVEGLLAGVRRLEWMIDAFNAGAGGTRGAVHDEIDALRPPLEAARESMQ
jgi:hypothetical protein